MGRCGDCCHKFGLIVYNPSKHTFCGRTCSSWALILTYFALYYTALAGFWIGMLSVFLYGFVHEDVPTLTGQQSLLKLNPGLGLFHPLDPDSPLIHIPIFDNPEKTKYLKYMEKLLATYDAESTNCNYTSGQRLIDDNVNIPCRFPKEILGKCADPASVMRYDENICIYLKLNRIYGFLPPVNGTEVQVTCNAANSFGANALGKPHFYPNSGSNTSIGYFSTVAFPYLNQKDYQQSILAVMFPSISRNTIVMVECKTTNLDIGESFRFDVVIDTKRSYVLTS